MHKQLIFSPPVGCICFTYTEGFSRHLKKVVYTQEVHPPNVVPCPSIQYPKIVAS